MSVPVTTEVPGDYRRVTWQGRLGPVAAVVGRPPQPQGAVLLVPGMTGSKEDYFALLRPLYERGWAVAAVDLPGMSESEGPADADYSLSALGRDVVGMLRQASGGSARVHLVGHSVGGLIAREAVLLAPQDVASLTLYDSGQAAVGPSARQEIDALAAALRIHTPGQVQLLKEALDEAAGKPVPGPLIAEFLRRRWALTSTGHLLGMAHTALTAPDRVDELAALARAHGVPLLVLYGAADTETWSQLDFAALADRLACGTAVIPDAAHSPAVENPRAMVDALDTFWRSRP